MHKVMIEPADYENCRRAVDKAFKLFPLSVKGKKVLVKPNALRAADADQGVTTHPAVVKAIVENLEELGAGRIIVGDNPGMMSYGANEKTFQQTGLMEAAGKYYENISADAVELEYKKEVMDKISVSRAVMDADVMISVPKFKTHGLTIVSGAIKNSYGILPGALKARLHSVTGDAISFSRMMIDIFMMKVPDLFIVDGILAMEGNGPASTDLRDVGLILASDNALAMDATISRIMGLEPARVPFIRMAKDRGLGEFAASAIELIGELEVAPDFKLPPSVDLDGDVPTGAGDFFASRIKLRPKADPDTCTSCETCVEQCPVEALTMEDGLPIVDAESCIACFCCQEMCPDQAIELK